MNTSDYLLVEGKTHAVLSEAKRQETSKASLARRVSQVVLTSGVILTYLYFSICEKNEHSYCQVKDWSKAFSSVDNLHFLFT